MPKHKKDFKKETAINQAEEFEFFSLEDLARKAAREMIRLALENEIEEYLKEHESLKTPDGKAALVRNGHHKPRDILISGGIINVEVPRSRNRNGTENFSSQIVPTYMRKSLKIEEAIPLLYLYGISERDIAPALMGLIGEAAKGVSATSVGRMKRVWDKTYKEWRMRPLTGKKYCYVWVDGINFGVQGDRKDLCTLVMLGVNENGDKEIIAVEDSYSESSETWSMILNNLKERGLACPKLFIGDGALGFWKSAKEVYPEAAHQRCWVHKIRNILGTMAKVMQPKAKEMLHQIYGAPTHEEALKAVEAFKKSFGAKYPRAVECLMKDIDQLLTFFNFPAEHWIHIRSSNAIESAFSTVRLRTNKMRGCGSRETILVMAYKLLDMASKRWRRIRGHDKVKLVLDGVVFVDGDRLSEAA
jgi:transposase-like protein